MATQRVKLTFKENLILKPLIYEVAHYYDITTNIRAANITDGATIGWVILDISGVEQIVDQALGWLCNEGTEIELMQFI